MDPCDPRVQLKDVIAKSKVKPTVENQAQLKAKSKGKGKGKKNQEDDRFKKPIQKLWYEALSPQGFTYYWHIETNGRVVGENCMTRVTKTYSMYNVFDRIGMGTARRRVHDFRGTRRRGEGATASTGIIATIGKRGKSGES